MTWETYRKKILPYWLHVTKGFNLSIEDINESCPYDLQPYADEHILEVKEQDERSWINGMYTNSATANAVERNLAGRKARSEYIKQPIMSDYGMTQEEIDERELKRMIADERKWSAQQQANGMKKTQIR